MHTDPQAIETIAQELAALGEPAITEEEMRGLTQGTHREPSLGADVGLASLLFGLAACTDEPALLELEARRAWQRVSERLFHGHERGEADPEHGRSSAGRHWPNVTATLAIAAALALTWFPRGPHRGQHENTETLGVQAKAALRSLGFHPGAERARALALADASAKAHQEGP